MSVVFVVVPVIAAGWPAIAAAVGAACAALGYTAHRGTQVAQQAAEVTAQPVRHRVELAVNAEVIGEALAREQSIQVEKEGVIATFTKDARGRLSLHVDGERTPEELAAVGQLLLNRVRQQYAYEKVKSELLERGFVLVDEHVDENQSIRLSVRRFQ